MRVSIPFSTVIAVFAAVSGCGGPQIEAAPPERSAVQESDEAIAIIRRSFEAMGGLERLRLAGGKVAINAKATAHGKSFPVAITIGGPDRYRVDYPEEEISFVHNKGECRKIAYGVSARCTKSEAKWLVPVRVISGLTFPAGDAANLESTFHMREETTIDGRACVVPEIRPKNTNLKIRAAYDKATGLLAEVSFWFKDEQENKTTWSVGMGDWREVKKMMVPFSRRVRSDETVIWEESASSVDFDAFDDRAFLPPVVPSTDQPFPYSMPARRMARAEVFGQAVLMPAPFPTVGGASNQAGATVDEEACEVIRMIHRGPISKVSGLFSRLEGGALAAGRKTAGDPSVILLEEPDGPDDPALMIVYARLAAQDVSVKVSM